MSESKRIGCCAARTWSLTTAGLNIVWSGMKGIANIISLIGLPDAERKKLLTNEQVEILRTTLRIKIFIAPVDIFMAFVLILGVHRRSSGAVLAWICYACVITLINAGLYLADNISALKIIIAVIFLCVRVIFIYIVHTYWKEIKGSSGQNVVTGEQDGL